MKKTVKLVIALAITVVGCNKEQETTNSKQDNYHVSLNEARLIAQKALQDNKAENVNTDLRSLEDEEGKTTLYIANDLKDGGFAIISGDKRTENIILGYGDDNLNINDLPANLKFWLENTQSHITQIRNERTNDFEAIRSFDSKLANLEPAYKRAQNKEINATFSLKTDWNQGCVYNTYSPAANSTASLKNCEKALPCGKAYTGCVATGLSMVVNYYKSMPGYDYNILKNSYTDTDLNSPSGNEVGKLIKKIADVMLMKYECTGSGSFAGLLLKKQSTANALGFKYTPNYGNPATIKNTLTYQLKNKNIVVIESFDNANKAGHLYLLDGTYTDPTTNITYNHINWGWGGKNNGWFVYNDFKVGKYNFKDNTTAFYGFYKK